MPEVLAHSGLLRDTELHVEDTGGGGRPIVLIHGWPFSSASWEHQIPALSAAGLRVVAYDRRGFGRSDKPWHGFGYDTLADDLSALLIEMDLSDVTLVGFSMGGGEVARYISRHGEERLRSVVLASSVTPYMMKTAGNPDGPLEKSEAAKMTAQLTANKSTFFEGFIEEFFSVDGNVVVSDTERRKALAQCEQANKLAALETLTAFGATDFRDDLKSVSVPVLVTHGDSDAVVPFDGSGLRTHEAIPHSEVVVFEGAPHGCNVSHADEFNSALIEFLG